MAAVICMALNATLLMINGIIRPRVGMASSCQIASSYLRQWHHFTKQGVIYLIAFGVSGNAFRQYIGHGRKSSMRPKSSFRAIFSRNTMRRPIVMALG